MKDSQPEVMRWAGTAKYIKESNERFSTCGFSGSLCG